jgi:hypothetical protein
MKQFRGLGQISGEFELSPEEVLKVKRWITSFENVICICMLSLTYTRHIMALPRSFYSSDILRSVIMRTKVLMLHLLEGTQAGVRVSDMYDIFQVNHNPNPNQP